MVGKLRIGSTVALIGIAGAALAMAGCTSAATKETAVPASISAPTKQDIGQKIAEVQSDPKIPAGAKAMIVRNLQSQQNTAK